jgi:nucleoside-triphosphatase THEP1
LRRIILLYGEIGEGKTRTALAAVNLLRAEGATVLGVVSQRVFIEGKAIGYDLLNLETGASTPLVRLKGKPQRGWSTFGNPLYTFSQDGFAEANRVLIEASTRLTPQTVVFVDEYGGLEIEGFGILPGLLVVADAISRGGSLVVLVRTSRLEEAEHAVGGLAKRVKAGDPTALKNALLSFR